MPPTDVFENCNNTFQQPDEITFSLLNSIDFDLRIIAFQFITSIFKLASFKNNKYLHPGFDSIHEIRLKRELTICSR